MATCNIIAWCWVLMPSEPRDKTPTLQVTLLVMLKWSASSQGSSAFVKSATAMHSPQMLEACMCRQDFDISCRPDIRACCPG